MDQIELKEREAVNWIIRNNFQIQYNLEDSNLKQVLIDAYMAGVELIEIVKEISEEELEEKVLDEVNSRMEEDYLVSYQGILLENL